MLYVMRLGTWSVWTLVNSCYCLLILVGKLIQSIVFGELRVIEQQHLKDKFWNFVFYKFIFIFGVMNVQSMDEVVLWVAWFSGLGFLHLLTQLSKDRSEYLSYSPATPWSAHVKLLSLLVVILLLCLALLVGCVWVAINVSFTIFTFLAAESVLVMLKSSYVVVRYLIQLWDMSLEGVWEGRSVYLYYTELLFELVILGVDFAHHLHMLLYGNIFLSMASLVICMQLRFLFYEFQRRIRRHKNYLRVVKDMESKFPMATQEDLEQNADDCAICWEKMNAARKLPCGHLFHNSCLRSWLEQDTSCPTCRTALSETGRRERQEAGQPRGANLADAVVAQANQQTTNHFFHFDGSRYVSWLPSFSVEVTHTNLMPGQQAHATQTSQLDNMAREVQIVFPSIPQSVIMEDLRLTRSVDLTIDNILEGRIIVPQVVFLCVYISDCNKSFALCCLFQSLPSLTSGSSVESQQFGAQSLPSLDQDLQVEAEAATDHREVQDSVTPNVTSGSRFSKSASERMNMLEQRKQVMLEQARRAYQASQDRMLSAELSSSQLTDPDFDDPESSSHQNNNSDEDVRVRRRALLLEATQRRLDQNSSS
ncbi:unnamed protein product [Candidula unifasciata]|uniref:Autocrine motility factor receptor n=1 Tax=Candidula unifasciata TaxID=100452 RepID=A0A8S3YZ73_9EUPU|nr:unnamed protein product [Candidula unifasciata]